MYKYERMQLNTFMYSDEKLTIPREDGGETRTETQRKDYFGGYGGKRMGTSSVIDSYSRRSAARFKNMNDLHSKISARLPAWKTQGWDVPVDGSMKLAGRVEDPARALATERSRNKGQRATILQCIFYEELDYLIASNEEQNICKSNRFSALMS